MHRELDPEYSKASASLKDAGVEPADPLTMPLAEAREAQDRYFAFLAQDPPAVESVSDFEVSGPVGTVAARIYYPSARPDSPLIWFVRRAGWCAGSRESQDRRDRLLANESGFAVL